MLFDAGILERRTISFDETLRTGAIDFSGGDWKQPGDLNAAGTAELLDPSGSRTIRVQGRVHGCMEGTCGRCLELVSTQLDGHFDLFYYPMSMIAKKKDISIQSTDTEIGFYEDPGVELADVLREQILLWLPMSGLCGEGCKGICSQCGKNLNLGSCSCEPERGDTRWDSLRNLQLKN